MISLREREGSVYHLYIMYQPFKILKDGAVERVTFTCMLTVQ
jgi:hypothetical protein